MIQGHEITRVSKVTSAITPDSLKTVGKVILAGETRVLAVLAVLVVLAVPGERDRGSHELLSINLELVLIYIVDFGIYRYIDRTNVAPGKVINRPLLCLSSPSPHETYPTRLSTVDN